MADVNLKAKITLQDDASKPLASVKAQLAGLAQGGVGAAMAGNLLAGGLTGLASGAASLAMQAAQGAWALGEMGAQSLRTEASFERLARGVGESGQAMLAAMQAASQGTVSNADLAINENARRLAAIANEGLIGQDWLGEFAAANFSMKSPVCIHDR